MGRKSNISINENNKLEVEQTKIFIDQKLNYNFFSYIEPQNHSTMDGPMNKRKKKKKKQSKTTPMRIRHMCCVESS